MNGQQGHRSGGKQPRERRNGGQQSNASANTIASSGSTRAMPRAKPHKAARSVDPQPDAQVVPRKLVMRNLPANFTKDAFLQHVSPIPEHTYLAFHGPDKSLANQARSRAYIRLRNDEDIAVFKEKFDGYVFLDSRGHELRCVVEIAPYQRVAAQNQEKADNKCGDIFNTEDFKRFVEDLEKKKDATTTSSSVKVQASLAALEKSTQPENKVTPLMKYLQQQRQEEQEQHNRRRHDDRGGRQGGPPPSSRKERQRDKWGKQAAATSSPKVTGRPNFVRKTATPELCPSPRILEKPHDGKEPQRPQIAKKSGENAVAQSNNPNSRPPQQSQPPVTPQGTPSGKSGPNTSLDKTSSLPNIGTKPSGPDSDRGRHYFAERPGQGRGGRGGSNAQSDQRGPPVNTQPRDGNNGSGSKTMVFSKSGRNPPNNHSSRPGTSGGAGGDSQQRNKGSSNESVVITGMKEFGRRMPVQQPAKEERPPSSEVQSSLPSPTSTASQNNPASPDEGQPSDNMIETGTEGGSRVPNRARPAIQLYQPRGKRRYQN